mgnify:CR=1 FL=1
MGIHIHGNGIDIKFGIMSMPYRKNKALYVMNGNVMEILAYFRSDIHAQTFDDILNLFVPTKEVKNEEIHG